MVSGLGLTTELTLRLVQDLMAGMHDDQKAMYLSVSLGGQAQGVYGNLASKDTSYDDLVRALEEIFAPPN